ncbi:MAG: 50S ribosomal protein L10 [Malacoplasma sp.]
MKKIIKQKDALVSDVATKINNSKSFIIFEYAKLTACEMSDIRRKMLNSNSVLNVYKNNILTRALQKAKINEFGDLVGQNAIAFGNEDEIAPLRIVYDMFKLNDFINIKGSYIEKKYMDHILTKSIASLPNREGMYSMLLSCLTSPIRGVLYALKAVADTKQ